MGQGYIKERGLSGKSIVKDEVDYAQDYKNRLGQARKNGQN